MSPDVRHPRALAAFRVLLLGVGVALTGSVLVATLGFLLVVGVLGTVIAALTGEAVVGGLFVVSLLALLAGVLVVAGTVYGLRRVERYVTARALVPTPIERVKRRYVDGEIGEYDLEHGLEHAITGREPPVRIYPDRLPEDDEYEPA